MDLWGNKDKFISHGTRPAGYADKPGSGPRGQTCRTCDHLVRKVMGKTYLKCLMAKDKWTGGRKSDVLASAPACSFWKMMQPK